MDAHVLQEEFAQEQSSFPLRFLYDNLFNVLRNAIILEEYPPGSRLHEGEIAETLHVSRTPVLRALSMLAEEGLVEYHEGRGYLITKPDYRSIRDIMIFRESIEPVLVYHAAKYAGERDIVELRRCLQMFKDVDVQDRSPDSIRRFFYADKTFHDKIRALCSNVYLNRSYDTNLTSVYRSIYFNNKYPYSINCSATDAHGAAYQVHLNIYYAIRARNGRMGMEACYSHLRQYDIRTLFQSME